MNTYHPAFGKTTTGAKTARGGPEMERIGARTRFDRSRTPVGIRFWPSQSFGR